MSPNLWIQLAFIKKVWNKETKFWVQYLILFFLYAYYKLLWVKNPIRSIFQYNMDNHYWSVRSSSRRRRDGIKDVDGGGIVILSSNKFYFIRVHDNLM